MRKRNSKVPRFRGIEVSRFQGSKVSRKVVAGHISCIYDFSLRSNERNLTAAADKNTKTRPVPHNMRGFKVVWLGVMVLVVMMLWLVGCKTQEQVVKDEGVQGVEKPVIEVVWVKDWNVLIYESPKSKASIITMMKKGARLKIVGRQDEWYKIKIDGKEGWIRSEVTSKTQVEGIKIEERKLSKQDREKVRKYIKEAEYLMKNQGRDWEKLEKEYKAGKVGYEEYVNKQREISSYPTKAYYIYKKAYEIDANNLEVMKGLLKTKSEMHDFTPGNESIDKERLKPEDVYLCNRALTLNPPDKEWWYFQLGAEYEKRHLIKKAKFFYKKGIDEIELKKGDNTKIYPVLLFNYALIINNTIEKEKILKKIIDSFPDWAQRPDIKSYYQEVKLKNEQK